MPISPFGFGAELLDPREYSVSDALFRDPRSLLKGGRVLRQQDQRQTPPLAVPLSPEAWSRIAATMPDAPPSPLPANVGTDVDLDAKPLDPRTAGIGDLLTRSGQAREQGRQAGEQASAANAFGVGLQAGGGLNFNDEAAGLSRASGLPDWTPPLVAAPVGLARMGLDAAGIGSGQATQDYADQRDYARGYQEAATAEHPVAMIGGHLAGGFALPTGAAREAGTLVNAGRGLVAGAGYGAASGFGSGEGLADRAYNAGTGGTLGGTMGAGVGAIAGRLAARGAPAATSAATAEVAPAAAVAGRGQSAADEATERLRAALGEYFGDPSFGRASGAAGPEADAAIASLQAGLESAGALPSFVPRSYGSGERMIGGDGLDAVRAGIMRNLEDPTLGARPAAETIQRGSSFAPYGMPTLSPKETRAFGDVGRFLREMAPAGAALGAGVAGAGAAMADPAAQSGSAPDAAAFDRRFGEGLPAGGAPSLVGGGGLGFPQMPKRMNVPSPAPATADLPAPSAVPAMGQAPGAAAPAAPAEPPSFGSRLATALKAAGESGFGDQMLAMAGGLLSAPGGAGFGKGLTNMAEVSQRQGATDLARSKQVQEQRKLTGNAQYAKKYFAGHGKDISDAEAMAYGSNPEAMNAMFKKALPADEVFTQYTDTDGNRWNRNTQTGQETVALQARADKDEGAKITAREQALVQRGIDPKDPRNEDYILTGRRPREDQQKLTAGDKKAINAAEDEALSIDNTLSTLSRAREVNRKTYTGYSAGTRGWLGTALPDALVPDIIADPKTASDTREFNQIMSMEAIKAMSQTLKGATTDREMERFVEVLGDPTTPPDIRERTIDRMATLAMRQKQLAQSRINDMREGTYYQPGKGGAQPVEAAPVEAAPMTPAKRLRFDPRTGGFN